MENFGVLAAFELAQAIHAVRQELKPFVLVISNDPDEPVEMGELPDHVGATSYLTDLTSLVASIVHTREARGSLAVAQLSDLSRSLTTPACRVSFAHIRVWPERVDPRVTECAGNFSKKAARGFNELGGFRRPFSIVCSRKSRARIRAMQTP